MAIAMALVTAVTALARNPSQMTPTLATDSCWAPLACRKHSASSQKTSETPGQPEFQNPTTSTPSHAIPRPPLRLLSDQIYLKICDKKTNHNLHFRYEHLIAQVKILLLLCFQSSKKKHQSNFDANPPIADTDRHALKLALQPM